MSANLGSLEETILLLVLILGEKEEAYGVSVARAYKEKLGKNISIPAIHTVLGRLERKGLVKSSLGESTPARGGKRKRIYTISKLGYKTFKEMKEHRLQLWSMVPVITFSQ